MALSLRLFVPIRHETAPAPDMEEGAEYNLASFSFIQQEFLQ